MKKCFLKLAIIVCSFTLIIGFLFNQPSAFASTQNTLVNSENNQTNNLDNKENPAQQRVGQVAIFFGGIVVAWILDGAISYKSGKAPSEWVNMGLKNIEKKIKNFSKNDVLSRPINVSQNGQVSGCIKYPCQIQRTSPDNSSEPTKNSLDPIPLPI